MNRHRGIHIWSAVLIAAMALPFDPLQARDSAARVTDDTAIRALHTQIIEAYNHGDAAGASGGFAPDGSLITGDATRYVTPPEIEPYLSRLLEKLPRGTRFVATVTDVRFAEFSTKNISPKSRCWSFRKRESSEETLPLMRS